MGGAVAGEADYNVWLRVFAVEDVDVCLFNNGNTQQILVFAFARHTTTAYSESQLIPRFSEVRPTTDGWYEFDFALHFTGHSVSSFRIDELYPVYPPPSYHFTDIPDDMVGIRVYGASSYREVPFREFHDEFLLDAYFPDERLAVGVNKSPAQAYADAMHKLNILPSPEIPLPRVCGISCERFDSSNHHLHIAVARTDY